jgi:hypothetical protein
MRALREHHSCDVVAEDTICAATDDGVLLTTNAGICAASLGFVS